MFFDLYPAITSENQQIMAVLFSILLDYAVFAFIINFLREIIKDLEDINGDSNQGMKTLPIIFGVKRTSKLVFALSFIPIISLLIYIKNYFMANNLQFAALYSIVFVLAPLIYFSIKSWESKNKKDFHKLSILLKWILLFGILSIVIITLNIKYNASK